MLLVLAALGVVGKIKTPYSRNDYKAFLGFVRLHHSYVVRLYDIETFFGNTVRIAQHDFPIGPSYRADFLTRLNILSGGRPSFPGEAVASAPN